MPGMVGHTTNLSIWEAEECDHEFKVSLNHIASLTLPWMPSKTA